MPTLKPIDSKAVISLTKSTRLLVTAEEHNITGGLFSAVSEVLAREHPARVVPIATPDIFGESGTPDELAVRYKLDSKGITEQILKVLKKLSGETDDKNYTGVSRKIRI